MSQQSNKNYHLPIRIYYEDTDAGGVVFYANYLKFFERARTEWLRHCGINQSQLRQDTNCIFVVVNTDVNYKRPAVFDDLLTIKSQITQVKKASCTFEQVAYRDDQVLTESIIHLCCVDADSFKPMPIPQPVHAILTSLTQGSL